MRKFIWLTRRYSKQLDRLDQISTEEILLNTRHILLIQASERFETGSIVRLLDYPIEVTQNPAEIKELIEGGNYRGGIVR